MNKLIFKTRNHKWHLHRLTTGKFYITKVFTSKGFDKYMKGII